MQPANIISRISGGNLLIASGDEVIEQLSMEQSAIFVSWSFESSKDELTIAQFVRSAALKVELSMVQCQSLTLVKVEPEMADLKISTWLSVHAVKAVLRIVVPSIVEFLIAGSVAAIFQELFRVQDW